MGYDSSRHLVQRIVVSIITCEAYIDSSMLLISHFEVTAQPLLVR